MVTPLRAAFCAGSAPTLYASIGMPDA